MLSKSLRRELCGALKNKACQSHLNYQNTTVHNVTHNMICHEMLCKACLAPLILTIPIRNNANRNSHIYIYYSVFPYITLQIDIMFVISSNLVTVVTPHTSLLGKVPCFPRSICFSLCAVCTETRILAAKKHSCSPFP